jgi:hypothetical protein
VCGYKTECPCQVAGEAGGEAGANGVEVGVNGVDCDLYYNIVNVFKFTFLVDDFLPVWE